MPPSHPGMVTVVLEMWNSFPGEDRPTFAVVGCCKPLGWWNPSRALVAQPTDADRRAWRATFTVPIWFTQVEFKWLTIDPVTMQAVKWEETPFRILPVTQNKEKVTCWFDSKGTATKILPVNLQDSHDVRDIKFERCMKEIQVYLKRGLDVEIRYEYVTSNDVREEKEAGICPNESKEGSDTDPRGSTVYQSASPLSSHSSPVCDSLVTDVASPEAAAAADNKPEVPGAYGARWKEFASAGLLAGGAYAAWGLARSLNIWV